MRLIQDQPGPDVMQFEVQVSATITVTKNDRSGYREATAEELAPYGKVLKDLGVRTKAEIF